MKFCSHSTPKGDPACAKASKLYDWNVRNIAKVSPKMVKKQLFFDFFRFSLTDHSIRTNISSHSTPYLSPICAMASKSYGWDVRNIAKINPKMAKNQPFSFFFDFRENCPYDSNEIFYSHFTPYYGPLCAILLNLYGWDVRNIAKFSPKMAKKNSHFSIFSKTVHTIRTKASQKEKDLSRLLYRICGSGFTIFGKVYKIYKVPL